MAFTCEEEALRRKLGRVDRREDHRTHAGTMWLFLSFPMFQILVEYVCSLKMRLNIDWSFGYLSTEKGASFSTLRLNPYNNHFAVVSLRMV